LRNATGEPYLEMSIIPAQVGFGVALDQHQPRLPLTAEELSELGDGLYSLLALFTGYRAARVGWDPEAFVDPTELQQERAEELAAGALPGLVLAEDIELGVSMHGFVPFAKGHREAAPHRVDSGPDALQHLRQLVRRELGEGAGSGHLVEPLVAGVGLSPQEWEAAHQQLLVKEKALTRARDALAAERRRMPWLAVEKDYEFDGPEGRARLVDLFDGRRQLIVYRAFFEPGVSGWPDHACVGCSMVADHVGHLAHLNARDTTLAFASRAPQPDIARVKARMGWQMPWYTITDEFDADFGVDEWHGTNAFIRDGDRVFRTYFINSRGDEALGSTWSYLDMTALGRQEEWEDSPEGYPQTPPYQWWHWHDEYGNAEPARG